MTTTDVRTRTGPSGQAKLVVAAIFLIVLTVWLIGALMPDVRLWMVGHYEYLLYLRSIAEFCALVVGIVLAAALVRMVWFAGTWFKVHSRGERGSSRLE